MSGALVYLTCSQYARLQAFVVAIGSRSLRWPRDQRAIDAGRPSARDAWDVFLERSQVAQPHADSELSFGLSHMSTSKLDLHRPLHRDLVWSHQGQLHSPSPTRLFHCVQSPMLKTALEETKMALREQQGTAHAGACTLNRVLQLPPRALLADPLAMGLGRRV